MDKDKKSVITVREMPVDLWWRFGTACRKNKVKIRDVVRTLVEEYVKKNEKK
jgi:hypothetical protein